jgi:hypothetical protein
VTDKEFLEFMAARLISVYGESEFVDFVRRMRSIALVTPPEQTTDMFLYSDSTIPAEKLRELKERYESLQPTREGRLTIEGMDFPYTMIWAEENYVDFCEETLPQCLQNLILKEEGFVQFNREVQLFCEELNRCEDLYDDFNSETIIA